MNVISPRQRSFLGLNTWLFSFYKTQPDRATQTGHTHLAGSHGTDSRGGEHPWALSASSGGPAGPLSGGLALDYLSGPCLRGPGEGGSRTTTHIVRTKYDSRARKLGFFEHYARRLSAVAIIGDAHVAHKIEEELRQRLARALAARTLDALRAEVTPEK